MAVIMTGSLLIGCTGDDGKSNEGSGKSGSSLVGNIPVSFPLTTKTQTLRAIITGYNGWDQENIYVWKKYEEMTGVDINWKTVTKETRSEEVHNALTNKQQYDLIIRCKLSASRLATYGRSGLITDLAKDDLLRKNAPNCWAYLQSHPDTLASVMNPDGTIYALPQVNSGAELRVGMKLYVNKLWLQRLNLELPTTTEEFREMLTAFKEQDANGNGDPNDEIPMSCEYGSARLSLYGAFGLENRGSHNETIDCDPDTGKVRFIESSEQYKSYLEYIRGLYADGLIDKRLFTLTNDQWVAHLADDRVGVFANTNLALLPADKTDNWVAIDEALTGPYGDKLWSGVRANFHSTGAALIPSTCSDPALVLRWLDYFWTDEGTLFYHMGVEGETYEKLENGTYDYSQKIYDDMKTNNISFDDAVGKYTPYPGGSNPTVEIAPYFMGGEMASVPAAAAKALIEYGPEEYWPSFTFTDEENNTLDEIRSDISKYCENMRIDFVTGAKSLDEWDSYTDQLEKLRTGDMLSVYQAAVDRYHALVKSMESDD